MVRIDEVVRLARGRRVLHIGMGGYIDDPSKTDEYIALDMARSLHARLAGTAKELVGFDVNPVVVEAMKKLVPCEYVVGDLTEPGLPERIGARFDLVVFAEVIEHLDCFREALSNIRGLLAPGGEVVITTANAYALERIGKMVFGYEAVHDEHTSYFSYMTLRRLLAMNGYEITHFRFAYEKRYRFAGMAERIAYYAMVGTGRLLPQFSEGVVLSARPIAGPAIAA
ncbi:MAG: class I SAM-dependent methyltransferase [Rhodospirillales bacterium]